MIEGVCPEKIAQLFDGWDETLIWSCLQGCMGSAYAPGGENPQSAAIAIGDFCFFAGTPCRALVEEAGAFILVPQSPGWSQMIEALLGPRVQRRTRYAIKKEPGVFDREKLAAFVADKQGEYDIRLFDGEIYRMAMDQAWSRDFCAQFDDCADYCRRGLGAAALFNGRLVAGASSYTVYRQGIEIEIDTHPDFRQRGLATACAARLILACLERGLYPSWDACDLRSVSLAEKLGYHRAEPYEVYMRLNDVRPDASPLP